MRSLLFPVFVLLTGVQLLSLASAQQQVLPSLSEIELKSDLGKDYTKLRDELAEQDWFSAESEWRRLVANPGQTDSKSFQRELASYPCVDLKTVDQLWATASGGRFGYSVQKRMAIELGLVEYYDLIKAQPDGVSLVEWHAKRNKIWSRFKKALKWRGSSIIYNLSDPPGHLPQASNYWSDETFYLRLNECGI